MHGLTNLKICFGNKYFIMYCLEREYDIKVAAHCNDKNVLGMLNFKCILGPKLNLSCTKSTLKF